jgi:hypothetical protein
MFRKQKGLTSASMNMHNPLAAVTWNNSINATLTVCYATYIRKYKIRGQAALTIAGTWFKSRQDIMAFLQRVQANDVIVPCPPTFLRSHCSYSSSRAIWCYTTCETDTASLSSLRIVHLAKILFCSLFHIFITDFLSWPAMCLWMIHVSRNECWCLIQCIFFLFFISTDTASHATHMDL